MKEDVITMMMEELRGFVPNATIALIDERDMYIAKRIKQSSEAPRKDIKPILTRPPKLRSLKNWEKMRELLLTKEKREIKKRY